ncbi:uncharacterized protein LOC130992525 [Salvia miltiorrhiza]|uniref:uncharacterized protein LOC130992525 n=1 Tax=Salvia miltiorrhiza TaxID=226208 RepID=UPI0025ACBE5A|nr:uncharacterized protein LOC130992525 [Salvia miltiorrhiza]
MDPDEIAKRVAEMRLSAGEQSKSVRISATDAVRGQSKVRKMIMGKIFSERIVNREALRDNLPSLLKPRGTMEIELIGRNTFAISLDFESDRDRITYDGPWHFFNELMILQQADPSNTAANTTFEQIPFWVQLHNMPIAYMDPHIIRRIGEQIGQVLEIDDNRGGSYVGCFARVKVLRSINNPLIRCVPLKFDGVQEDGMILVLYEKLPDHFCFACGKLGHYLRNCGVDEEQKLNPKFGNWLKAGRGIDYRKGNAPRYVTRMDSGGPLIPPKQSRLSPRPQPQSLGAERILNTGSQEEGNDVEGTLAEDTELQKETEEEVRQLTIVLNSPSVGNISATPMDNEPISDLAVTPTYKSKNLEKIGDEMVIETSLNAVDLDLATQTDWIYKRQAKRDGKSGLISPAKSKSNPKRKGWKRLARVLCNSSDNGLNGEQSPHFGQKRVGRLENGGDRKKLKAIISPPVLQTQNDLNDEQTAEAAEQPRRSP